MTQARTSPRAVAKRRQIALAARELFLSDGYARTSMDAVTQAAGVSKQTLYAYFPSKEVLLRSVVVDELTGLLAPAERPELRATRENLPEVLFQLARGYLRHLMTPTSIALLRLMIGEAASLGSMRNMFREAVPVHILGDIREFLAELDRRDVVRIPNLDASARMLVGSLMVFVAIDGWMSPDDPVLPSDDMVRTVVGLYLRTLDLPEVTP
ncbi:MAG: TetR/AcrR family transcriptional regulator [Micropruina sp.]|nr:MAG: TetR/AcrR family transcriptional regulator [Micropruina sp.]